MRNFLKKTNLYKFTCSVCAMSILILSCNNDDKEAERRLRKESLDIYTDILAKRTEIESLKLNINAYNKSISIDDNVDLKDSLLNVIILLGKTEDRIEDFDKYDCYPNCGYEHSQMMTYLTARRDSVKQLANDVYMVTSVANNFWKKSGNIAPPQ